MLHSQARDGLILR